MFCSFICDQMICFEVTQSLVGNLQVKPRVVHLWLEWSEGCGEKEGSLIGRPEGGESGRGAALEGWGPAWNWSSPDPEEASLPSFGVSAPAGCIQHSAGRAAESRRWAPAQASRCSARAPQGCQAWALFWSLLSFPLEGSSHSQNIELIADFCFVATNSWMSPALSSLPNWKSLARKRERHWKSILSSMSVGPRAEKSYVFSRWIVFQERYL